MSPLLVDSDSEIAQTYETYSFELRIGRRLATQESKDAIIRAYYNAATHHDWISASLVQDLNFFIDSAHTTPFLVTLDWSSLDLGQYQYTQRTVFMVAQCDNFDILFGSRASRHCNTGTMSQFSVAIVEGKLKKDRFRMGTTSSRASIDILKTNTKVKDVSRAREPEIDEYTKVEHNSYECLGDKNVEMTLQWAMDDSFSDRRVLAQLEHQLNHVPMKEHRSYHLNDAVINGVNCIHDCLPLQATGSVPKNLEWDQNLVNSNGNPFAHSASTNLDDGDLHSKYLNRFADSQHLSCYYRQTNKVSSIYDCADRPDLRSESAESEAILVDALKLALEPQDELGYFYNMAPIHIRWSTSSIIPVQQRIIAGQSKEHTIDKEHTIPPDTTDRGYHAKACSNFHAKAYSSLQGDPALADQPPLPSVEDTLMTEGSVWQSSARCTGDYNTRPEKDRCDSQYLPSPESASDLKSKGPSPIKGRKKRSTKAAKSRAKAISRTFSKGSLL